MSNFRDFLLFEFVVFISLSVMAVQPSQAKPIESTIDVPTGIKFDLPDLELRGPTPTKFGSSWKTPGESLQIDTLRLNDRTLDALKDAIAKKSGRRIAKETRKTNSFVLEGSDPSGEIFYFSAEQGQSEIRAISIIYKANMRPQAVAITATVQLFAQLKTPPASRSDGAAKPAPSTAPKGDDQAPLPLKTGSDVKLIVDRATGIQLTLPDMNLRGPVASKNGSSWTDKDGRLQIDTLKFTDRPYDTLVETIRNKPGRQIVGDDTCGRDCIVFEGKDKGETGFYFAVKRSGNDIRALSITYKANARDAASATVQSVDLFPDAAESPRAPVVEIVPPTLHGSRLELVLLSLDNESFAVSSGVDGVVKLWDVATGRLIRNVARKDPESKSGLDPVALSDNGRRLLVNSYSTGYLLFDTITGKELTSIESEATPVMDARGSRVARVKEKEKTADLFSAETGKKLSVLANTLSVAFSPDGRRGFGVAADNSVYEIDMSAGKRQQTVATLDESVDSITVSPHSKLIAIRTKSGKLVLWNVEQGRPIRVLEKDQSLNFVFSPDGRLCAFQDRQGMVSVLELAEAGKQTSFKSPRDNFLVAGFLRDGSQLYFVPAGDNPSDGSVSIDKNWAAVSVSTRDGRVMNTISGLPDGTGWLGRRYLISSSDKPDDSSEKVDGSEKGNGPPGDGKLHLHDLLTGQDVREFGGQVWLKASAFSRSGSLLSFASGGMLAAVNAQTGKMVARCPVESAQVDVAALAISSEERLLAYDGREDSRIDICDLSSGSLVRTLKGHDADLKSLAFSPDDRQLLSGDSEGNVKLWDIGTGNLLKTFKGNQREARALGFSPDGRKLFAGTDDNKIRIWDSQSGRELKTLRMMIGPVTAMSVSSDGRLVAAGTISQLLSKQWDVESGKELRRLETDFGGRMIGVRDVKYSIGENILMATANDRIAVWDTGTGQKKLEIRSPDQDFKRISFSQDKRRIVSLDEAGVIRHWDKGSGAMLLTVLSLGEGDWIQVTPEGFFDASSPKAAQYLTVVRGLEVYSIDQFYNQLYRPDLVRERLAGDPAGKVKDAATKLDLTKAVASGNAPRVAIVAPASGIQLQGEQVVVEAEIFDQGGGIGKVEWRVNGVTLGVEERGVRRTDQGSANATKVGRTLGLTPGDNKVAVLAYNEAGLIASEPVEIKVNSVQQTAAKPRLYVLAVGVNDYWDSALKLSYAAPDAKTLSDGLRQAGGKLYEQVNVRTVLDAEATAEKLDGVFKELAGKIRPQDVFVFFLAGHGKTVDARFYFLPQDFRYQGEDSITKKGVGQNQLQDWVSRIKAQKSVLLFDACESGSLVGDKIAMRGIEEKTAIDRMTRAMGRTVLTATTDSKPAIEGYRGHGVFTYTLLAGFNAADANGDGVIDVTELATYVDRRLPDLTYDVFKMRQVPQMSIVGSNFPLASRVALLPAEGTIPDPTASGNPAKPTHFVVAPADFYEGAAGNGDRLGQLPAGTAVSLIKTEQGWVLVAREGKAIGYVAEHRLVRIQ